MNYALNTDGYMTAATKLNIAAQYALHQYALERKKQLVASTSCVTSYFEKEAEGDNGKDGLITK